MSHEIEYNKEKESHSFAAATPAWHKLGQIYGRKMTSTEALEGANLDFEVDKKRNHIFVEDGVIKSNSYSTYRTDSNEILGTVGSGYTIVQNKEGFDFIDILAGKENKMIIDSAGSLRDGSTIFITAKLPKYIKLFGQDLTEMYVVFTNNHSGISSLSALITPVRVVCNNTLAFALSRNERRVNLRHTKNVHEKIKMADEIMEKTSAFHRKTQELFEALASQKITEETVDDYLARFFLNDKSYQIAKEQDFKFDTIEDISSRSINTLLDAKEYHYDGPGQDIIKDTAFGLYNTITGYQQNVKEYKTNDIKMENTVMEGLEFSKQNNFFKTLIRDFVS